MSTMKQKDKKKTTDTVENPAGPTVLTKKQFGDRIRNLLMERGWNQAELARQAGKFLDKGMGRDNISIYVNGRSFPGGPHLYALACAFNMEPADLLPNVAHTVAPPGVPLEIRGIPGQPGRMRLKIDQEISFDKAVKIMQILEEDQKVGD